MAILTLAELKVRLPSTGLDDDDLRRYLDAAEEDIVRVAGPAVDDYLVTSVTEWFSRVTGALLMLGRAASSITSIQEYANRQTPTTLAADDYELMPDGVMLRRKVGGTNSSYHWHPPVRVEYDPMSDVASRERVQIALVQLDVNANHGVSSEQIGSWTQQSQASSVWNYAAEREAILESLRGGGQAAVL